MHFSILVHIYIDISANISCSGAVNTATLGLLFILGNYYFRTCCWLQLFIYFWLKFVIFPGFFLYFSRQQSLIFMFNKNNKEHCSLSMKFRFRYWRLRFHSFGFSWLLGLKKSSSSNFNLRSFFFEINGVIYYCDMKGNNLN